MKEKDIRNSFPELESWNSSFIGVDFLVGHNLMTSQNSFTDELYVQRGEYHVWSGSSRLLVNLPWEFSFPGGKFWGFIFKIIITKFEDVVSL